MQTRLWDRQHQGALPFPEPGFGTAPIGVLYRPVSADEVAANASAAAASIPGALWADRKSHGLLHPDAPTGAT